MPTKTSPSGIVVPISSRPAGAILGDFDIDGSALKPDHRDWLDRHVVEPARARIGKPGMWLVDLVGRASRTGADAHNRQLSLNRLREVQSYLSARMTGIPVQFFPEAQGESSPRDWKELENAIDRSVEVRADFSTVKPKHPTIPLLIHKPHIWKPRENRKVRDFTLKVEKSSISIFGFEFTAGFIGVVNGTARVKLLIRIDEVGTPDFARFNYEAAGPGSIFAAKISWKGAKPGISFSEFSAAYQDGRSHPFATEVDLDAQDFAGAALFRFNAMANSLAFGPSSGFFRIQEKVRPLSLGMPSEPSDVTQYGEGEVAGEMEVVTETPEWAR